MKSNKNKEIAKYILKGILAAGAITIASTSPYFLPKIMPKIIRHAHYKLRRRQQRKNFYRSFYYLKKQGYIRTERKSKQIYISLTKKGKDKAGKYQIDDLKIKKPKKWDKKWRILIFDIKATHKIKREALRGKIKQLSLYQLQKSVWVHPYNFHNEMKILRKFFNLTYKEIRLVTALDIENNAEIKAFFNLA